MTWQPNLKEFQRRSPIQLLDRLSAVPKITEPTKVAVPEQTSVVDATTSSNQTQTSQYEIPIWKRSAFTLDPEYMDTALTVKPLEELLAIAYLRSVRSQVTRTGLSYLASYSGRHRCLVAGEKVLMAGGTWKNIEDVIDGDLVLSPQHDGKTIIARVIATHCHFENEVYDVVEASWKRRKLYTCSGNHLIPIWAAKRSKKHPKTERKYGEYTARYLSKITSRPLITYSAPCIDFNLPDSAINPHCLGMWLGDGHCRTIKRRIKSYSIGITTNDDEIIDAINRAYPWETNSIQKKNGTTAVTVEMTTRPERGSFFLELKRLGLLEKNSGTKFIPNECLLSTAKYRLKLLAGLIDTDGYAPKDKCCIEITTKSKQLADDILNLVCSLGGYGKIGKIKKGIKSIGFVGEYFCVRFAFAASDLPALAAEICVVRKKERILEYINLYRKTCKTHASHVPRHRTIRCIPTHPQMVYGFTLDSPSHLFVTNRWLLSLNSGKSVTACAEAYMWDHTFWPYFETRIVQSPKEFVSSMRTVIDEKIYGAAFVIDEAGATMASSDWYEKWIKAITKTLQICGMLRPMILFVAPSREYIVSGMRRLIIAENFLERFSNEYSNINVYHVKYSTMRQKYYYKKPVVRIAGQTIQLKRILFHKPPDWFIDRYKMITEPHKTTMMENFAQDVERSMSESEAPDKPDYESMIEDILTKVPVFIKDRVGKDGFPVIDQTTIEIQYGIRSKYAKYVKERVERGIREKELAKQETDELRKDRIMAHDESEHQAELRGRFANLKKMKTKKIEPEELESEIEDAEKEELDDMDENLKEALSSLDE